MREYNPKTIQTRDCALSAAAAETIVDTMNGYHDNIASIH